MASLTKMAGTALGSAVLAAIPASAGAAPILETEPNNTFPGQPATVGVTYQGTVSPGGPADLIDFYHYKGLLPGSSFDLSFDPANTFCPGCGPDVILKAGLYTDQTTIGASVTSNDPLVHLTGTIPGSGELVFGITMTQTAFELEGYTIVLNARGVPAPATIVLLAAGIAAMGLDVARRRKRS